MYIFENELIYLYGRKVARTKRGNCQNCSLYSICLFLSTKRPKLSWLLYKCFDPRTLENYNFRECENI